MLQLSTQCANTIFFPVSRLQVVSGQLLKVLDYTLHATQELKHTKYLLTSFCTPGHARLPSTYRLVIVINSLITLQSGAPVPMRGIVARDSLHACREPEFICALSCSPKGHICANASHNLG